MWRFALLSVCVLASSPLWADESLRIATFTADVTPPLGSPLCDALCPPAAEIVDRLSARGVVLLGAEKPIVLCAIDWVGIGNGGYDAWRHALATAAGTSDDRVALHCLHQHDAPGCDFDAEALLAGHGLSGAEFHVLFAREAIERTAAAVHEALPNAVRVSQVGLGVGRVEQVASNRRLLGPDGKVRYVRYSSCRDPVVRDEPEGVIDPDCRLISFWHEGRPLASITYYTTHPQSFYGAGGVSADFVGLARARREHDVPEVAHIHFNGASGNVAAGKYNDGSPEMRPVLAERLAAGMEAAWKNARLVPVSAADVQWRTAAVALPPSAALDEKQLADTLADSAADARDRVRAARDLAWLYRARSGKKIDLSCLALGPARLLHLPGELFVEYQLAAEKLRPELHICTAAYGDYGPGYIGTAVAYEQGGYETSRVSRVAPEVEAVLTAAIRELLKQ